jgi:hypothetical protein
MNKLKKQFYVANLLQGVFTPSKRDQELYNLAEKYHKECEAYDKTVCTGGKGPCGGVMPAGHFEMVAINKNALRVRGRVFAGFTKQEVTKAISEWHGQLKESNNG